MDLTNIRFPRFFVGRVVRGEPLILSGEDLHHATKVLRLKIGEKVVFCDDSGLEYICAYTGADSFEILAERENDSEPKVHLRLFQCAPKSDKLDLIVQKATELGASEIIPVISKRCVSRPDSSKKSNKIARLEKISEAAAKQSGRGKIPLVHEFTSFSDALKLHKKENLGIIFYENGGIGINEIIAKHENVCNVDVFIGSEGGFEPLEIEAANSAGLITASLGKRILRTETAPIAAIAVIMNLLGEM
ncbi:MAG: 16S rRNA (uracil(1498)-N(3))-methyltransferase [Oscillospiraceae bacterium]|nr:16S rRNA (uracil(1498)-N(3))-methyltransferase [Oscillospiraceae bacterium]